MDCKVVEKNNKKYILAETPISSEQEALDIIGKCFENNIYLLMLNDEVLPEDFFKLRTGLAGMTLQKFINYHIKVAAVISKDLTNTGKFKEMMLEANKGTDFRVFKDITDAENWLLN